MLADKVRRVARVLLRDCDNIHTGCAPVHLRTPVADSCLANDARRRHAGSASRDAACNKACDGIEESGRIFLRQIVFCAGNGDHGSIVRADELRDTRWTPSCW